MLIVVEWLRTAIVVEWRSGMRTYAEPIMVRLAEPDDDWQRLAGLADQPSVDADSNASSDASGWAGASPAQFIWRQRLWRVLRVQRCWSQAEAWWDRQPVERRLWLVEAACHAEQRPGIYTLANAGENWWLQAAWD